MPGAVALRRDRKVFQPWATAVERRGLLGDPQRSPGGYRLYDDRAVQTLRIIKAAQRLGFTLDEIADLLEVGRRRGRDRGLQARASSDCCPVPFAEITRRDVPRPV